MLEEGRIQPDYTSLLQHVMRSNPDKAAEFSAQLLKDDSGPLVDIDGKLSIVSDMLK